MLAKPAKQRCSRRLLGDGSRATQVKFLTNGEIGVVGSAPKALTDDWLDRLQRSDRDSSIFR